MPWFHIHRPIDTTKLSRDPDEAQKIRDDKLMHSRISLHLATQLLSQGRWAMDQARRVNLPTLIAYGRSDAMIDTSACHHLAIRMGDHASEASWPEMQHDLLHDLDRQQVIEHLIAWLDETYPRESDDPV